MKTPKRPSKVSTAILSTDAKSSSKNLAASGPDAEREADAEAAPVSGIAEGEGERAMMEVTATDTIATRDARTAIRAITSGPTAIAKTTTDAMTTAAILYRQEIFPLAIPTSRLRGIVTRLAIRILLAIIHLATHTRRAIAIPTTADATLTARGVDPRLGDRLPVARRQEQRHILAIAVRRTDPRHPDTTAATANALPYLHEADRDLHFLLRAVTTTSIDVPRATTCRQRREARDRPSTGTAALRLRLVTEAKFSFVA